MNRSGRIVGGILIAIAVLWLLRIANALPFNNRTTNQFAANTPTDRPPITDPNFGGTGTEPLTAPPSPPRETASRPSVPDPTNAPTRPTTSPAKRAGW